MAEKKVGKLKRLFNICGPGLISGAADDDPSGIATYSQTGARFGFDLLWAALYMLPFLIAIQELCARIGGATGEGIAAVVKKHYGPFILYPMVILVLIANVINISANLAAIVASFQLLFPANYYLLLFGFALTILLLLIFLNYKNYCRLLIFLCIFLLAYPMCALIVKPPFFEILKFTFVPAIEYNFDFIFMLTALFGTTISPYLFFWQASQVTEEKEKKGIYKNSLDLKFIKDIKLDNLIGMIGSQVVAWSIIIATAATLHAKGVSDIITAADVAKSLKPLVHSFPNSGFIAEFIFSMGIIGSGLLSIPVLAGSAAFACGEAFNLTVGVNKKFNHAKGFYIFIILAVVGGVVIDILKIDPIKALVYSAVINGVISVPLILLILLIGNNKKIMTSCHSKIWSNIFVSLTFIGVLITTVSLFLTWGK